MSILQQPKTVWLHNLSKQQTLLIMISACETQFPDLHADELQIRGIGRRRVGIGRREKGGELGRHRGKPQSATRVLLCAATNLLDRISGAKASFKDDANCVRTVRKLAEL